MSPDRHVFIIHMFCSHLTSYHYFSQNQSMKTCQASLIVLVASALGAAQGFARSETLSTRATFVSSTNRRLINSRLSVATTSSPFVAPQANPNAIEEKESLSGVSHQAVLEGLEQLYPPRDLVRVSQRATKML
jgi:hypothetical protein